MHLTTFILFFGTKLYAFILNSLNFFTRYSKFTKPYLILLLMLTFPIYLPVQFNENISVLTASDQNDFIKYSA